jgi:hypothetical protein
MAKRNTLRNQDQIWFRLPRFHACLKSDWGAAGPSNFLQAAPWLARRFSDFPAGCCRAAGPSNAARDGGGESRISHNRGSSTLKVARGIADLKSVILSTGDY